MILEHSFKVSGGQEHGEKRDIFYKMRKIKRTLKKE